MTEEANHTVWQLLEKFINTDHETAETRQKVE